ncbi:MAG TPA: pyrroline-5-carboxylate reductase [Pseudonocardiaceae bacterium]|jgi:pyrroline-5-carboxylate reductase|nr:pyrroline-5-carboxylate reductase [Pseudonocardiaceae bacterium]
MTIELTIIGGGNMGEALLSGLLAAEPQLLRPEQIAVVELSPERAAYLRERYGVPVLDLASAVRGASTVFLFVKPYHVDDLLPQLTEHVTDDQLIVSAVGGITIGHIEAGLAAKPAVVRCMPNTAVAVGAGMIGISAGSNAGEDHLDRTTELLRPVGRVVRVPETQLDAVTALSGSGPAYFFLLAEAMIDAGVLVGLTRQLATELVTQTAAGAGLMLRDLGSDPVALRAAVSSPGGMTIAAVRELEEHGLRAGMMAAVAAARDRSVELGQS